MDENIKFAENAHPPRWGDDIREIRNRLQKDEAAILEWKGYSQNAPSVDEFNSPSFGKEPIKLNVEPEIYSLNQQLTPETKEKILQEFETAARIAGVKPIEGHVHQDGFYGENPLCPILNNPDEILTKIQEVFHTGETTMEEEDGVSDKHFILSYIQAKMPKRTVGWREGSLYVDGARTNITYQSLASLIAKKLQKVFGN